MGCSSSKATAPAKVLEPGTTTEQETKSAVPQDKNDVTLKLGDTVSVAKDGGFEAMVVRVTATNVLVKTKDGQERWYEVEDCQQWTSAPPLAKEVKVGSKVTSCTGAEGEVIWRTTTEVCLRTADGKEEWCAIEDITVVEVVIVGATGLRNADWASKSDPYCTCELEGKPATQVKTHCISDILDPVWNFQAKLIGYTTGDSLKFVVYDSDMIKTDDFLGTCMLTSDRFVGSSFCGEVPLLDKSGGPAKGTLNLRVSIHAPPAQPAVALQEAEEPADACHVVTEPEVAEVRPDSRGWCC